MRKLPRFKPRPGDEFGKCPRCSVKFIPDWCDTLGCFDRCCTACQLRNLADGFGLPGLYAECGLKRDALTPFPESEVS